MPIIDKRLIKTLAIDAALCIAVWVLAYQITFPDGIPNSIAITDDNYLEQMKLLLPWVVITLLGLFAAFGVYTPTARFRRIADLKMMGLAALVHFAIWALLNIFLENRSQFLDLPVREVGDDYRVIPIPWMSFAVFYLLGGMAIGGWRLLSRAGVASTSRNEAERLPQLVVGSGQLALRYLDEPKGSSAPPRPICIVAFDASRVGNKLQGIPIVGTVEKIPEVLRDHDISIVCIALDHYTARDLRQIVEACRYHSVKFDIAVIGEPEAPGVEPPLIVRPLDVTDLLGLDKQVHLIPDEDNYLYGESVLITGAGGSVGSEILRQIGRYRPARIVVLGKGENSLLQSVIVARKNFPDTPVEIEIADVRDEPRMREVFRRWKPTVIFHAAAHKNITLMEQAPGEALRNNIIGTAVISFLAREAGVKRFVYISSDAAVRPTSVLGATKRFGEELITALADQLPGVFVVARLGEVIGARGSLLQLITTQIQHDAPVTISHPDARRSFMTLEEAVSLLLQAGRFPEPNSVLLPDRGEPFRVAELARNMISLAGKRPEMDIQIEYVGLKPGEKLTDEIYLSGEEPRPSLATKLLIGSTTFHREFPALLTALQEFAEVQPDTTPQAIRGLLSKHIPDYEPAFPADTPAPATPLATSAPGGAFASFIVKQEEEKRIAQEVEELSIFDEEEEIASAALADGEARLEQLMAAADEEPVPPPQPIPTPQVEEAPAVTEPPVADELQAALPQEEPLPEESVEETVSPETPEEQPVFSIFDEAVSEPEAEQVDLSEPLDLNGEESLHKQVPAEDPPTEELEQPDTEELISEDTAEEPLSEVEQMAETTLADTPAAEETPTPEAASKDDFEEDDLFKDAFESATPAGEIPAEEPIDAGPTESDLIVDPATYQPHSEEPVPVSFKPQSSARIVLMRIVKGAEPETVKLLLGQTEKNVLTANDTLVCIGEDADLVNLSGEFKTIRRNGRAEGAIVAEALALNPAAGALVVTSSDVLFANNAIDKITAPILSGEEVLVYSDYTEDKDGAQHPVVLHDHEGCPHERFEFGPVIAYNLAAIAAVGGVRADLNLAWEYDLHLKLMEKKPFFHHREAVYTRYIPFKVDEKGSKVFSPGMGPLGGFSYVFYPADVEKEVTSVFEDALRRRRAWIDHPAVPVPHKQASYEVLASIVIPILNRVKYIGNAIEKVQQGTFPNFEMIIVDNGSTDGTIDKVKEIAAKDSRIRLIHGTGGSIASALNEGIKAARGKYICQLDSDDEYAPDCLEQMIGHLESHPNCGLAISYYRLMDENGVIIEDVDPITHSGYSRNQILRRDGGGAVRIFPKAVLEEFGYYDEEHYGNFGEDYDMVLKTGEKYDVDRVHKVLYHYRRHADNTDVTRDPAMKYKNKNRARQEALRRRTEINKALGK